MEDDWIAFLRDKQGHFRTSIELLKAGRIGTSEQMAGGTLRDTTAETIAQQEKWLAEIEELLGRRS